MAFIQGTKNALRQAVSSAVRALPEADVQRQSEAVLRHVLASPVFQQSTTVSCYLSMKGEVDTRALARAILLAGKSLYVPKIESRKDCRMDFLRIYCVEDLESLPSGVWGIKEPGPEWSGRRRASILDEDAEPLDLILVPGVAFDRSLSRLGHGKGYYDFFIDTYKTTHENSSRPRLFALSLRVQMLPPGTIPMAEHDHTMDAIVTPDGIVKEESVSPDA